MTRPGLLLSTTTRSPSLAASRTLWVTNSTVSDRSAQIRSSSSCSRSRVIASSAPNGSSISSTSASWRERPGERDPLPHAAGQLVRPLVGEVAEVHGLEQLGRRCLRSSLGTRLARSASSTFLRAVSHGNSAGSWNMIDDPPAAGVDLTRCGRVQAGDDRQQRGLAAAGRADQADELARARRSATAGRRPGPRPGRGRRPWRPRSSVIAASRPRAPCRWRVQAGAATRAPRYRWSTLMNSPAAGRAAFSSVFSGPRSYRPGRFVTGLSRPTETACCASAASEEAIGSLVKVICLNDGRHDARVQALAEQRGQFGVGRRLGAWRVAVDVVVRPRSGP